MPHPRKRTWTFDTLDPRQRYELWLDPVEFRWEVRPVDQVDVPQQRAIERPVEAR